MAPGKHTGLDAAMLERLEKLAVNIPGVIYQYQQWPDGRIYLGEWRDGGAALIAILLILTIIFTGFCAFLGWYSRRRG